MDQELLKTSKKQRLIIAVIAILMIGSFIASYAAIVLASGSEGDMDDADRLVAKYSEQRYEQQKALASLSRDDFNKFIEFKGRISAYNESNANANGLEYEDLVIGDGRTLEDGDTDYYAQTKASLIQPSTPMTTQLHLPASSTPASASSLAGTLAWSACR